MSLSLYTLIINRLLADHTRLTNGDYERNRHLFATSMVLRLDQIAYNLLRLT